MDKRLVVLLVFFLALGTIFGLSVVMADDDDDNSGSGNSGDNGNSGNSGNGGDNDNSGNNGNSGSGGGGGSSGSSDSDDDSSGSGGDDDSSGSGGDDDSDDDSDDRVKTRFEERRKIIDENGVEREIRVRFESEERDGEIRTKIRVRSKADGEEFEIETKLRVREDEDGIKVELSNGNKQEIKIMPDRASEIAINVLLSKEIEIELREVSIGGESRVVYHIETEKDGKFFGLIKTKVRFEIKIDPETGEVIEVRKRGRFRALFIFGENSDETGETGQVTLCHVPRGNPDNAQTITVGRKAVRAHLTNHGGDQLGACEGDDGGDNNDTIPDGNETMNLTLDILSPEEINYTVSEILVDISSNGDVILFSINGGTNETYNGSVIRIFPEGANTLTAFASLENETESEEVMFTVILGNETIPGNNETIPDGNETIPDGNETIPDGNETGNSTG